MDLCAELTLQVVRHVQQPREAPASPREWVFVPEGRRANWIVARDLLSAARKPLIVSPLAECGMIGTWAMHALHDEHLARAEHGVANQQQWLAEHADHYRWTASDLVVFETEGDKLELPLTELQRWLQEYAVIVGWTVGEGPDANRPVRLSICRPTGDWSPGMACHHHGPAA